MTKTQWTNVIIGVVVAAGVIGAITYVKKKKEKEAIAKAAAQTATQAKTT